MQLSLSSVMMLLLAAGSATACEPGKFKCAFQKALGIYKSQVLTCNALGEWVWSSNCPDFASRPCCDEWNNGAYCRC